MSEALRKLYTKQVQEHAGLQTAFNGTSPLEFYHRLAVFRIASDQFDKGCEEYLSAREYRMGDLEKNGTTIGRHQSLDIVYFEDGNKGLNDGVQFHLHSILNRINPEAANEVAYEFLPVDIPDAKFEPFAVPLDPKDSAEENADNYALEKASCEDGFYKCFKGGKAGCRGKTGGRHARYTNRS